MTDTEIEEEMYRIWRQLELEAHPNADDFDDLCKVLRFRLKELREIEWRYKELCK